MIMLLVGLTIGAVIGFGVAALLRGGDRRHLPRPVQQR